MTETVNIHRTEGRNLTVGLPNQRAFDLEAARRRLIAQRVAVGADTPIGHRLSNMVEQIQNYLLADDDYQASRLRYLILKSGREIDALRKTGKLPPPQARLTRAFQ